MADEQPYYVQGTSDIDVLDGEPYPAWRVMRLSDGAVVAALYGPLAFESANVIARQLNTLGEDVFTSDENTGTKTVSCFYW